MKKSISFSFLNARSVRNKAWEVNEFVTDDEIDLLAICKTWLAEGDRAVTRDLTHEERSSRCRGGVGLLLEVSSMFGLPLLWHNLSLLKDEYTCTTAYMCMYAMPTLILRPSIGKELHFLTSLNPRLAHA